MYLRCVYILQSVVIALACNDAILLPELDRRARNYKADGTIDPYVNDFNLVARWYTVYKDKLQYLMPDSTKMPDYFTCGGYEPIYIKDAHPVLDTLSETPVGVTTCLRTTFGDCQIQYSIQIRKCNGNEIQYYLVRTKQSASYCLDPPHLQDGDIIFSPPPSNVNLGVVKVDPRLFFDEEAKRLPIDNVITDTINYRPFIKFICDFKVDKSLFYSVNWILDGQLYKLLGPTQTHEHLILSEKTLIDENIPLGFTIACGVRVSQNPTGLTTTMVSSPEHYAGVTILTPEVSIPKSEIGTILFKLTIPLGCEYNSHNSNPPCKMGLGMFDPGEHCGVGNIAQVSHSHLCYQDVDGMTKGMVWNPDKEYFFNITSVDVHYSDKDQFVLQLQTVPDYGHKLWNSYLLHNIKVNIIDMNYKMKRCYSHIDPHMKTADGYQYENQEAGDFLLYRNKKYGIEVQERYVKCYNAPFCTCGVIIRAGGDVFTINQCSGSIIEFLSCEDNGILKVVEHHNTLYMIYTPIGTVVKIAIIHYSSTRRFLNVDIEMAAKDFKNTEGLCGFMDGNPANDLKDRNGITHVLDTRTPVNERHPSSFTQSWKLSANENLFTNSLKQHDKWEKQNPLYCVCEKALGKSPTPLTAKALCSPSQYIDCILPGKDITQPKCNKVKHRKRSIRNKQAREMIRLMSKTYSPVPYSGRTTFRDISNNITEIEAHEVCSKMILESVVVSELSDSIPGDDPDAVVDQCVFDVLAANDKSIGLVHVDALNSAAQMTLARDPVFVQNNTDRVEHFVKNSCPSNCSEKGVCSEKGECICEPFHHGSDCSIDERVPLVINDMEGGGLCNLTDGDGCECFYIRTFYLLPNFTCDISGEVTYIDGSTNNITSSVTNGIHEDIFTGQCCVIAYGRKMSRYDKNVFSTRYDIALSNDGNHFGPTESIHVFDSECQNAVLNEDNEYLIELKDTYCFIDGICVGHGEVSLTDSCLICNSEDAIYNWTTNCWPKNADPTVNRNIAVVLGASLGTALTVILVGLVIAVWHFKLKSVLRKKRSVGDSQTFMNPSCVNVDQSKD